MPAYTGKFQYLDVGGAPAQVPIQQGPCELSFDSQTCTVTPPAGTPLTFDLGDVDEFTPAEWELSLTLSTGARLQLRQFGPAFGRMCEELLAGWRDRTVECLLLEDLAELARYQAIVNGSPAEIRIYGSNLAVLPLAGPALQWRLAELDSISFDAAAYTFQLASGAARLSIARLAKKTNEFGDRLRAASDALRRHSAEVLHQTFPFLNPAQVQQLVTLAPEGRSVPLAALARVHPALPEALIAHAVDDTQKPYFESLKTRAAADSLMTGFKFIRPDEAAGETANSGDARPVPAQSTDGTPQPLFFWFFFPLAGRDIAAWEAFTGTGRATYFFRAAPPAGESIACLTRGLALVNFRREPVYLPDQSLDRDPRFHRYDIGRRKLPELAELRAAFLGRAIHSSLETWEKQVEEAGAR